MLHALLMIQGQKVDMSHRSDLINHSESGYAKQGLERERYSAKVAHYIHMIPK